MSLPTNSSKIADKLVFNFHSDPGHGWLAVKKSLIRELGLAGTISRFSYMKGQTAYLEVDCDMGRFFDAFKAKFGIEPKINELQSRENTPIRNMDLFWMEA